MSTHTDENTTTAAEPDLAVRENLDPATLLLDHNVRLATTADKTLVESIRDHGVLQAITAVRTADGGVRVRYGHRRTLAAIEAGLAAVPVDVVGVETDNDIERIVGQWAENEHREALTTADRTAAVAQLAAFGLSASQIAKRTKAKRAAVDEALTVADSELATKAAARYDFLTLGMAATVAEFDSDPDTVKRLITAAKDGEGEFAHTAERARLDRANKEAHDALLAELAAAGVPVIEQPSYENKTIKRLDELKHGTKDCTPDNHATCPGHAAWVSTSWNGARATYACTDPKAHGHESRYGNSPLPSGGPLTGEEKAERAKVRENNTAWRAAETVRRQWLTTFLARKSPPKGTAAFLALAIAEGDHSLRRAMEARHPLAVELLGMRTSGSIASEIAKATEGRADMLALGLVLAAHEAATDVHTWRNPSEATGRYLTFLADNGYALADVERIAIPTKRRKS